MRAVLTDFTWDQHTPNGKCLRNWGDDQIYDYRFDYDPDQRITRSTDSRGHTTVYHYNALGLIVKEIDAEGGIHHSRYDDNGDLIEQQDPDGRSTHYHWNDQADLIQETDPLGNKRLYTHDDKGQILSVTAQAAGQPLKYAQEHATTQYAYTANGHLTQY